MSNAYESGKQKIIPAVLLYAFYQNEILMINARSKDGMPGKWNGLGGKLETGESMMDTAVREFKEEASVDTEKSQWKWLGELYFPNFKAHKNEDWWVAVFIADLTETQAQSIPLNDPEQSEGSLHFIAPSKILSLDLWDGDQKFLPFVFSRTPFQGTFFYEKGSCTRYEVTPIVL